MGILLDNTEYNGPPLEDGNSHSASKRRQKKGTFYSAVFGSSTPERSINVQKYMLSIPIDRNVVLKSSNY